MRNTILWELEIGFFAFAFVAVSGLTLDAMSAETPPFRGRISATVPNEPRIIHLKNLSLSEKTFYWREKTLSNEGFIRYEGPMHGVSVIQDTVSSVRLSSAPAGIDCILSSAYKPVGFFVESPWRKTFVFCGDAGMGMLTRWDLAGAGASVSVVDEFMTVEVKGKSAIAVLSFGKNPVDRAIWQTNWYEGAVQYELYLETSLKSDSIPAISISDLLSIANNTRCDPVKWPTPRESA